MAEAIENAFRYGKIVLASASYDSNLFPPMDKFLRELKSKNYQNRKVWLIENGTWAPSAGKCMKEILCSMKNIEIIEPMVTIKSRLKNDTKEDLKVLAEEMLK